jgi:hypothetical protein
MCWFQLPTHILTHVCEIMGVLLPEAFAPVEPLLWIQATKILQTEFVVGPISIEDP